MTEKWQGSARRVERYRKKPSAIGVDKERNPCYNKNSNKPVFSSEVQLQPFPHGGAKVSTGVLRYDKRGGLGNPVKLSNLKNKRQQNCCSCSVSCDAAL